MVSITIAQIQVCCRTTRRSCPATLWQTLSVQLARHYCATIYIVINAQSAGSPYAVTEYSTNDELGSDADLTTLRKTLHGLELALMLDFVPNHSAVDSPWTQHLDWYCPELCEAH